ncbi:hypothetical protein CDAR_616021 [Caerostris darwini]|uniref:Uncharacterized protein n=1 Tax=Caerostris darwini TaxID=1538125 RepID=A0AAV4RV01_9ARAC|nr:hypothetical protein CDAR_616021 [Caerostris darwini]
MQEALKNVGSRRVQQIISRQSTDGGSRQRMSNVYISRESMLSPMCRRRKQQRTRSNQQRTLAAEEFGRSFQGNRLMVEAGRTQEAAEEFGRSFQGNRLMVEAGRVCRMCKFLGNRCYPQCEDAGSSRGRWQQKSSADHFKAID